MKIIIENGKPPQLEGDWTIGQVIEIARALEQRVLSNPIKTEALNGNPDA